MTCHDFFYFSIQHKRPVNPLKNEFNQILFVQKWIGEEKKAFTPLNDKLTIFFVLWVTKIFF